MAIQLRAATGDYFVAKIKDIVTAPGVAKTSSEGNCVEVFYREALMLVRLERGASTDAQTLKRR